MKKIGIFICNYNKADFVIKCVKAIKEQTYQDFDIFVVDNASEDNSVEKLRECYGESITILQNAENIGGSGGFGRAIRTALEMEYPYFMLVDNDAFMHREVVAQLYGYMEDHGDTGICGAETLHLQQPDKVQDIGGKIDYENYRWGGVMGGMAELEGNAILECDYVASCCVIARTEAVRKFGGFPEENFIYWDDIEWCTKCWRAGYKVIVNSHAKVYHDMSGANTKNMFLRYYSNRNRYKFFTKYLPQARLDHFYETITREFFYQNYGAINKGMYGTAMTMWNAMDDFMHGITGKAAEGKIVPYTVARDRLAEKIAGSDSVLIYMPDHGEQDFQCLHRVLRYLMKHKKDLNVMTVFSLEGYRLSDYDMVLQLCKHVTQVKENILPLIYVDIWQNCILDEKDYQYFSSYEEALENFQEMYRPLFEKQKSILRMD